MGYVFQIEFVNTSIQAENSKITYRIVNVLILLGTKVKIVLCKLFIWYLLSASFHELTVEAVDHLLYLFTSICIKKESHNTHRY